MGVGQFCWFIVRQRLPQSCPQAIPDFLPIQVISFHTSPWSMSGRPPAHKQRRAVFRLSVRVGRHLHAHDPRWIIRKWKWSDD